MFFSQSILHPFFQKEKVRSKKKTIKSSRYCLP